SGHKFTAAELPRDLWVEGVAASDDARDVQLRAYYKTPPLKAMPTEDKVRFTVIRVDVDSFSYFRPTSADSDHPSVVYTPIVKDSDKLYYKFKLKISPSSGLTGVKYHKVKVSLLDGATSLASEEHTFSASYYPDVTMITASNIDPLTIPGSVTDTKTYTFRIDAFVDANGTILKCEGVDTKNVETHFNAVEVGRKISGEDNGSDAAREQVKLTILNRWNFPTIANGHDFTRSTLRSGNATIYDLATDAGVFHGTADLDDTVQHARELAKDLLANPTSANGNGPIYFYEKTATSGVIYDLCNDADDPEVNLLNNTATYGNKYFSPSSDPNSWTTQTVKDGYDADATDSLVW
ncbi:MAG: hypothetical protein KJ548_14730, partial [Actinobacteria bacterium]|nr:hypothetical protein [Actinomycetota bacterium]MCG2678729.1 hypothetical protein [Kiritimatiellia bacterium]